MALGVVRVSVFGQSDVGRAREHNEDAFLIADLSTGQTHLEQSGRAYTVGPRGVLFMVADGMGGAAAGEVASAMATDLIYGHMSTVWPNDVEASAVQFAYRLREAVELANERIYRYARERLEVRGMGTTLTAAGVFGSDLYLTQIGDSRAYLIRHGEAIQLTKDQSLMQRLVDAGEMTEEEAAQSERRHIILQALGPDLRVKVDLTHQSLRRHDTLLVCSDGLTNMIRNDELAELATAYRELRALCSALIDLANARGGPDNITVIAARFEGEGLEEPADSAKVGYQVFALPEALSITEAWERPSQSLLAAVLPLAPTPRSKSAVSARVFVIALIVAAIAIALVLIER